ncbi:hypothetical protein CEP54_008055 [Fusarium duplospermum]|uniref:Uncharacterized protein n=1 Tax=Fusarium duplospermum TaxID=1325734 RepID=A0A428PY29_9HYPO|nr:hypothetical protein CEP54_008055 [Fusarium duplospermum]
MGRQVMGYWIQHNLGGRQTSSRPLVRAMIHPWQVSSLPYDRLRELDRTGPSDPDNPVGPLPDETLRRRHHGDEDPPARIIGLVPVPMSMPVPLLVALQAPAPHGMEHGCPRIKELGWGQRTRKNDVVATQPGHSLLVVDHDALATHPWLIHVPNFLLIK